MFGSGGVNLIEQDTYQSIQHFVYKAMADESGKAGVKNETPTHEDDHSSVSSHDAQLGVKHIEAISQTWTRWSLISAYVG